MRLLSISGDSYVGHGYFIFSDRVYSCEHMGCAIGSPPSGHLLRTYQTRSVHAYSLCIPYSPFNLGDLAGLLACAHGLLMVTMLAQACRPAYRCTLAALAACEY